MLQGKMLRAFLFAVLLAIAMMGRGTDAVDWNFQSNATCFGGCQTYDGSSPLCTRDCYPVGVFGECLYFGSEKNNPDHCFTDYVTEGNCNANTYCGWDVGATACSSTQGGDSGIYCPGLNQTQCDGTSECTYNAIWHIPCWYSGTHPSRAGLSGATIFFYTNPGPCNDLNPGSVEWSYNDAMCGPTASPTASIPCYYAHNETACTEAFALGECTWDDTPGICRPTDDAVCTTTTTSTTTTTTPTTTASATVYAYLPLNYYEVELDALRTAITTAVSGVAAVRSVSLAEGSVIAVIVISKTDAQDVQDALDSGLYVYYDGDTLVLKTLTDAQIECYLEGNTNCATSSAAKDPTFTHAQLGGLIGGLVGGFVLLAIVLYKYTTRNGPPSYTSIQQAKFDAQPLVTDDNRLDRDFEPVGPSPYRK